MSYAATQWWRRRAGDIIFSATLFSAGGESCGCFSAALQVNATQVGRKRYHVTLRTQLFSTLKRRGDINVAIKKRILLGTTCSSRLIHRRLLLGSALTGNILYRGTCTAERSFSASRRFNEKRKKIKYTGSTWRWNRTGWMIWQF